MSKGDGDKEPPKGFEKFFRKRNERKSAAKSEGQEESKEKRNGKCFESLRLKLTQWCL